MVMFCAKLCMIAWLVGEILSHTQNINDNIGLDTFHIDVIVLGGTGDLAQKYLWKGFFDLFIKYNRENTTFTFYACGISDKETGSKRLQKILDERITCKEHDKSCNERKRHFMDITEYFPLPTNDSYADLGRRLDKLYTVSTITTRGRIFYLSVPPSVFISCARNIHSYCYHSDDKTWFRIVLEKPFGSSKETAVEMSEEISKLFKESEIYRVDHYLGKPVVKQILPFRFSNRQTIEPMLNKEYVDRVEVFMKETIGVSGRIDFYDQYGVIRDVMQNHLTELLALISMDLPVNVSNKIEVEKNRLRLLHQIHPVRKDCILTGQYSSYLDEAHAEKADISKSHQTPTFSVAMLNIYSPRWYGVPFLLLSGKHLDERSSFIRIVFKQNEFCVSGCTNVTSSILRFPKQLVFQISHGDLPSAGILVSKSTSKPHWPYGMIESSVTASHLKIYDQNPSEYYYAVPVENPNAYSVVIDDLFHGNKDSFVETDRLIKLWDIWTPVLDSLKYDVPRKYRAGEDLGLNFNMKRNTLKFIQLSTSEYQKHKENELNKEDDRLADIPIIFLSHKLHCKETDTLIHNLALDIQYWATVAIQNRNVFHIALSGGQSPVHLFRHLVEDFKEFPWKWTHIWQVDEHCVPHVSHDSNFHNLDAELLQEIRIPHFNVHAMEVDVNGDLCNAIHKRDIVYEETIRHMIPDITLDYVVLGLGNDGHTASLFPGSPLLQEKAQLVSFVDAGTIQPKERMSMLLPLINQARKVSVLVTGKTKHVILRKLRETSEIDIQTYPIMGVSPTSRNMTWFVDFDSWFNSP